jgi:branched-chain amino acid transport system substrate-binding protein
MSMSRRRFIRDASGAAAVLGMPAIARAAEEATILGLFDYTGAYAEVGPLMERGAKLALEEAGYRAGDVKLRLVTRDAETKASSATRRSEEAIDSDGARFIVGPWSSGVALAVVEVAKNKKVMHWFSGGTEDISGKRCNRYAFQWAASPWTAMDAVLGGLKKENPSVKNLYLFVTDYAFGWSLQKYVTELAPKHGMQVAGADRQPLGQREYSSYITKAAAANPDAILMINFGLDTISAARQLQSFGLTPKIPLVMAWSSGVEELIQMSPEVRENVIFGSNFYYAVDTPLAHGFVANYKKVDPQGNPPGYAPSAGYALMRATIEGIRRANSAEVPKVIKALEGAEIDDITGKMKIQASNHQCIRPFFVCKTKPVKEMKDPYDFGALIAESSTPQPAELNECKDIGDL